MYLLNAFIISHLIPLIEEAFIKLLPLEQEALLAEIKELSDELVEWIDSKVTKGAGNAIS